MISDKDKLLKMLAAQYSKKSLNMIYLPEVEEFLRYDWGTGDNLDYEDYEQGYIGYFNINVCRLLNDEWNYKLVTDEFILTKGEGGMFLYTKEMLDEYEKDFTKAICDIIDYSYYGNKFNISTAYILPTVENEAMEVFEKHYEFWKERGVTI